MKLLYTAASIFSAVAYASDFSAADVQELQDAINQRLAQRSNLLENVRSRIARDLSSSLARFNFEKTRCSLNVAGFWNDCQQCLVQQCESFTQEVCGDNKIAASEMQEGVLQSVLENYRGLLAEMSRQTGMDFDVIVKDGLVLIVPRSSRKKRSLNYAQGTSCGQVNIVCESGNCGGMNFPSNVEVSCSDNSQEDKPLNIISDPMTSDGQWNYRVDATYHFEISDEADSNGNTVLKINFPAGESSSAERVETDQPSASIVDNNDDQTWSDSWSLDADDSYDNNDDDWEFNFDSDEVFPSMTENDQFMTQEELDRKLNEYCDQIGGCDDVQRKRRGLKQFRALLSRKKKSTEFRRSRRDTDAACRQLSKYPNNCVELGLPKATCSSCSQKISTNCPEFDAVRKNLSQQISESARVVSKFSNEDKVLTNFFSMNNGSPTVFIQRAAYNPSTGGVKLLMAVTDKTVMVQGKLPNNVKLHQLSEALV